MRELDFATAVELYGKTWDSTIFDTDVDNPVFSRDFAWGEWDEEPHNWQIQLLEMDELDLIREDYRIAIYEFAELIWECQRMAS